MQYEEDEFHPASNTLDYDDELGTLSDDMEMQYYNEQYGPDDAHSETITVNSQKNKYRKMWDDAKKVDKGFHKLKIRVGDKPVEIEVYSTSNTPGRMIRDAISGQKYNQYKVGSLSEHLFFKVRLAGQKGLDCEPLYFDTPEQYERHMKCEVSQAVKDKWMKNCAEIQNIEYNQDDNISDYVRVR